jgi:hypothetical protein
MRKITKKKCARIVGLAIKLPFEPARTQEAIDVSPNFWRMAIKQFNREFLTWGL